jgi:hypothetical protein
MGSTLHWATGSNRFSSKQSVGRRTAGCNISALLSRARRADGHPACDRVSLGSIGPLATLFSLRFRAYIRRCRREPAMAINGRRNKPFGPGGSTRRLHQGISGQKSDHHRPLTPNPCRGRNRIDEGVKGVLLLGMVPPLSGRIHSCQRQLCSGCPGRVTRFGIPN